MRIYIAGPYSAKTKVAHDIPFEVQQNVNEAIDFFWKLKAKGHIPYVPHLSHFLCINHYEDAKQDFNVAGNVQSFWYKFDLAWLDQCEAIFLMPKWEKSYGAIMEKMRAESRGMKVYYSIDEVPDES